MLLHLHSGLFRLMGMLLAVIIAGAGAACEYTVLGDLVARLAESRKDRLTMSPSLSKDQADRKHTGTRLQFDIMLGEYSRRILSTE